MTPRKERSGLLIKTITTRGELDEHEQLNIEDALEWTLKKNFKREEILTEKIHFDLHKKMLVKFGDGLEYSEIPIRILV